jgi:hypothetical protein
MQFNIIFQKIYIILQTKIEVGGDDVVGTAIPVASYTFCLKYLPQQILPTKVLAVLTDVKAESK